MASQSSATDTSNFTANEYLTPTYQKTQCVAFVRQTIYLLYKNINMSILRPAFNTMVMNFPYARQHHRSDFIWDKVGGKVRDLHYSNKSLYFNTCALRMSWALNNSGSIIPAGDTYKGADNRNYFISVDKLNAYLERIWMKPEIIWQGNIIPKVDQPTLIKQQHEKILDQRGLIHFCADGHRGASEFGASGHLDLWDGKDCIDEEYFGNYITAVRLWKLL